MEQALLIDVPPHAGVMSDDVRFTLDDCDTWLRSKADVDAWDLDVAACHESHRALTYYTLERSEDGLVLPWWGFVFCNPPWSLIDPWLARAHVQMQRRTCDVIGFVLPLRTHMGWWQEHVEPFFDQPATNGYEVRVRHPPTRFAFGGPGNPRGIGAAEPNFQSVGIIFTLTPVLGHTAAASADAEQAPPSSAGLVLPRVGRSTELPPLVPGSTSAPGEPPPF